MAIWHLKQPEKQMVLEGCFLGYTDITSQVYLNCPTKLPKNSGLQMSRQWPTKGYE
jgi:hypothetical protein